MSETDVYGRSESADQEPTAKFDRAELVRGWREYESVVPRCVPLLKFAAKTDMGQVRENNEDKFEFYEPEAPGILAARGCLYAVGDGGGGVREGRVADEQVDWGHERCDLGGEPTPAADDLARVWFGGAEVVGAGFGVDGPGAGQGFDADGSHETRLPAEGFVDRLG